MMCKNVVIVDDDQSIRDVFQFALESAGYSVFSAKDGLEGLSVLRKIPQPSLILLDLMMPVMDGWMFAKKIKSEKDLSVGPIIVVSAFNESGRSIKAEATMTKPVDLENLIQTVHRYCQPATKGGTIHA